MSEREGEPPEAAAESLERENAELRRWATTLEALTDERAERLDRRQRELESFLDAVSHDLKAPILSIQGFCGLLAAGWGEQLPEEARRYLARIDANAIWLRQLIDDLLELSRVGRISVNRERVDLMALAREAKEGVALPLAESGGELEIDGEGAWVVGERRRLLQVWSNLFENALRYRSPERVPRIRVDVRREGDELFVAVEDNGIGVAPADLERIFLPFERGGGTSTEKTGTGLGLAIVRRILDAHGGRVGVASDPGVGSRFFFVLPSAPTQERV